MTTMTVKLRGIPGTEASVGWAGAHTLVVDRPEGKAGGQGLGFNGGQLLGLAVGGCLCNDLYYVAHNMDIALASVAIDVDVSFDGSPLLATSIAVQVAIEAVEEDVDLEDLLRRAKAMSTVSNSIARGVPVSISPYEESQDTGRGSGVRATGG
ncbi:OsmC family protein [Microvirga puerhi]|uniref:OsmC family protein n=1 Tax=Microvirga puerhi TaxID=2876078 RepID=A0ABS7VLQ5_9HYPH|nr:OsmC family protein [Microvirga puerhi]MBZ6076096.1 OsmC family protein [Microvirga puerhi]